MEAPSKLVTRRAFDWKVVRALASDALGDVRGYVSHRARAAQSVATDADGESGRVVLYEVDFTFPFLVGPGDEAHRTTVVFDISSNEYPRSTPNVTCMLPHPWSTHVHESGTVCLGDFWAKQSLLAQLIVHVMRIINLDEPVREEYEGFNAEAYEYWQETLDAKPYVKRLAYPALPVELTHGTGATSALFAEAPMFTDGGDDGCAVFADANDDAEASW